MGENAAEVDNQTIDYRPALQKAAFVSLQDTESLRCSCRCTTQQHVTPQKNANRTRLGPCMEKKIRAYNLHPRGKMWWGTCATLMSNVSLAFGSFSYSVLK